MRGGTVRGEKLNGGGRKGEERRERSEEKMLMMQVEGKAERSQLKEEA